MCFVLAMVGVDRFKGSIAPLGAQPLDGVLASEWLIRSVRPLLTHSLGFGWGGGTLMFGQFVPLTIGATARAPMPQQN